LGCRDGAIADASDETVAQADSTATPADAPPAVTLASATAALSSSLPARLPGSTGAAFYVSPTGGREFGNCDGTLEVASDGDE